MCTFSWHRCLPQSEVEKENDPLWLGLNWLNLVEIPAAFHCCIGARMDNLTLSFVFGNVSIILAVSSTIKMKEKKNLACSVLGAPGIDSMKCRNRITVRNGKSYTQNPEWQTHTPSSEMGRNVWNDFNLIFSFNMFNTDIGINSHFQTWSLTVASLDPGPVYNSIWECAHHTSPILCALHMCYFLLGRPWGQSNQIPYCNAFDKVESHHDIRLCTLGNFVS